VTPDLAHHERHSKWEMTAVVRKLKIFQDSMKSPNSINLPGLEDKTFLFLVVVVSLAFA